MGYIRGMNRDQVLLFPDIVDEYIAQNNPVRFIDAYVESLDLAGLEFTHAVPQETGRPAYAPAAMLKLYIRLYQDLKCIMPHDQLSCVGGAYARRRGCAPACRELTGHDGVNRGSIHDAAAAFRAGVGGL
jgi:hypothetical protein